jgi:hypothetical protein
MIGTSFLQDIFDRRARTHSGQTVLDVLKIASPGVIGGVAPVVGPLSDLLDHVPDVARIVRVLVPIALAAVCFIIVRVVRSLPVPPGFASQATMPRLEYVFPQASRNAAKIALPFLLILTLYEAWDGAPNWVLGRRSIGGYVCQSDGLPVDRATTIVALDNAGEPVSREPVSVDDNGYVVISYRPWATRAAKLQLTDVLCGKRLIAAQTDARGQGCRRDPLRPPDRPDKPIWITPCTK